MGFIENAKAALEVAKQLGSVDLQQRIIDLQMQALELQEETRSLRVQVAEMAERERFEATLVFEDNALWSETPKGRDGPFCSRCWDADRKKIRLHSAFENLSACPVCNTFGGTRDDSPPKSDPGFRGRVW